MTAEDVRAEPRILIVDDDAVSVRLLAHILTGLARIQVTTKASEALALVLSGKPDLVLLDIEMPELDGFALCEQIRQQPGGDQTLVLFVTSTGSGRHRFHPQTRPSGNRALAGQQLSRPETADGRAGAAEHGGWADRRGQPTRV